jgi:hypothetical protein
VRATLLKGKVTINHLINGILTSPLEDITGLYLILLTKNLILLTKNWHLDSQPNPRFLQILKLAVAARQVGARCEEFEELGIRPETRGTVFLVPLRMWHSECLKVRKGE